MSISIKKSLISRLFVFSTIVWVFFSCKPNNFQGVLINKDQQHIIIPFFSKTNYEYHYSVKMIAFSNTLNGVLVVKQLSKDHKRVVMLSDFGNTLFDFEFKNGKATTIYVMEDLNKKIILNKLLRYFEFLTKSDYLTRSSFHVDRDTVYISKFKNKRVHIVFQNALPTQLELYSRNKSKAEVIFYAQDNFADSISFKSNELPIQMFFKKREKNINVGQ